MRVQDVITYQPKFFKNITEREVANYFYDENYKIIIQALRRGPLSLDQIAQAYKEANNEKSKKTLYRYLKTLQDVGLISEAGKRIITNEENRNKTVTLYSRTATIFYDMSPKSYEENEMTYNDRQEIKALQALLPTIFKDRSFSAKCIKKVLRKALIDGLELVREMCEETNTDIFEFIGDFDFVETSNFISTLGWLAVIVKHDIKKEILKCTEKEA